jgi:hypothetical protein
MVNARPAIVALFLAYGASAVGVAEPRPSTAIAGLVRDDLGRPLGGATVSVFGKSLSGGASTVVTDGEGRFELLGMPPGLYRLRAYLAGFLPSGFARVVIEEGASGVGTILMSLSRLDGGLETYVEETGESRSVAELRWVIQRQRRNILKDGQALVPVADLEDWEENPGFDPEFALSGEFGIRAATYDAGLEEFPGAGAGIDARLAYARLFIPTNGEAQWLVSAQLLESALSSWAGRAEYVSSNLGGHRIAAGVSYGSFLYGDLEKYRPPESVLGKGFGEGSSAEWFGTVYASDSFLVGPASVQAGLTVQYFDYLGQAAYASPRFEVSYPLGERTALQGGVERRLQAPGGEDIGLLSRVAYASVYGPTLERRSFRAESTDRFAIGLEHNLSSRTRLALRLFQENAADQLVRAFLPEGASGAGHFLVTNQGDFRTRGVGVALAHARGPVDGSVGYTFGRVVSPAAAFAGATPASPDPEIHDVTTTLGTSIDSTQTRLQAAYRVIYHPGLVMAPGSSNGGALDGRFSVQVFQLLPFVGWNGTQWELMVALRNLFYDDVENASILDELSVVDAPRRVLGGVTVRF